MASKGSRQRAGAFEFTASTGSRRAQALSAASSSASSGSVSVALQHASVVPVAPSSATSSQASAAAAASAGKRSRKSMEAAAAPSQPPNSSPALTNTEAGAQSRNTERDGNATSGKRRKAKEVADFSFLDQELAGSSALTENARFEKLATSALQYQARVVEASSSPTSAVPKLVQSVVAKFIVGPLSEAMRPATPAEPNPKNAENSAKVLRLQQLVAEYRKEANSWAAAKAAHSAPADESAVGVEEAGEEEEDKATLDRFSAAGKLGAVLSKGLVPVFFAVDHLGSAVAAARGVVDRADRITAAVSGAVRSTSFVNLPGVAGAAAAAPAAGVKQLLRAVSGGGGGAPVGAAATSSRPQRGAAAAPTPAVFPSAVAAAATRGGGAAEFDDSPANDGRPSVPDLTPRILAKIKRK